MNSKYLNRVVVFLQQELPEYASMISLEEEKILFSISGDAPFQPFYEGIFENVSASISRIRNLECDLDFRVAAKYQMRDFKILSGH